MSQETVITPQSLEPVAWWFLFTGIFTDYFVLRLMIQKNMDFGERLRYAWAIYLRMGDIFTRDRYISLVGDK